MRPQGVVVVGASEVVVVEDEPVVVERGAVVVDVECGAVVVVVGRVVVVVARGAGLTVVVVDGGGAYEAGAGSTGVGRTCR